jgi:hypothetical protein
VRYYTGTHQPHWLHRVDSRCSCRTAASALGAPDAGLPRRNVTWTLDSGGFTEISRHGRWRTSPDQYVTAVRRDADEIGSLEWAAGQDLDVRAPHGRPHRPQRHRAPAPSATTSTSRPWHGPAVRARPARFTRADYSACLDRYGRHGIGRTDPGMPPLVGLGSVCRRQNTPVIHALVSELSAAGLPARLRVKLRGIARYRHLLASADSMAWRYAARRSPVTPGHTHQHCGNCLASATA